MSDKDISKVNAYGLELMHVALGLEYEVMYSNLLYTKRGKIYPVHNGTGLLIMSPWKNEGMLTFTVLTSKLSDLRVHHLPCLYYVVMVLVDQFYLSAELILDNFDMKVVAGKLYYHANANLIYPITFTGDKVKKIISTRSWELYKLRLADLELAPQLKTGKLDKPSKLLRAVKEWHLS